MRQDFGEAGLDIVVHSLANGPEVKSPLVDTSRAGYLAAVSVSAYSNVSLVRSLVAADARGRRLPLADLHGRRAGHSRLRRRHVVGQGGARGRHPDAGLRGRPTLGGAGQRDLGRALGLPRRLRDRLHRHDDRVHQRQLAAASADPGHRRRATRPRSSAARSPARSPAAWSTWTTGTTRWAWRCRGG